MPTLFSLKKWNEWEEKKEKSSLVAWFQEERCKSIAWGSVGKRWIYKSLFSQIAKSQKRFRLTHAQETIEDAYIDLEDI